ncbi:MAG: hypothetical protein JNK58_07995 [Phycisphaerae bacterium]|nr:hypothetical protein [Phycisphaerae bacterium]
MPLKRMFKGLYQSLPGGLSHALYDAAITASNAKYRAQRASWARVFERLGRPRTVISGPFKGMSHIPSPTPGNYLPKLLGVYEMELAGVTERLLAMDLDVAVNVGGAEGYYSVGLAWRNPKLRVISFEMKNPIRHLMVELAALNGVGGRVEARGTCDPALLKQALDGPKRPLVICDCEGYEDVLLRPDEIPALKRAVILVETHDPFCPGVSGRLRERFGPTHTIEDFRGRPRVASDLPEGVGLTGEDAMLAMEEDRSFQPLWFLMIPKAP